MINDTFIKIKENVGVRMTLDRLDLFDNEKTLTLKGSSLGVFRKEILPFLFMGIHEKFFTKKMNFKRGQFNVFLEKLKANNILDSFSAKTSIRSEQDINNIAKLEKNMWRIIDLVIVHQRKDGEFNRPFFIISARYKNFSGKKISYSWATGVDLSFQKAYIKSVAEAIERYHSSPQLEKNKFFKAPFNKLRRKAIDPRDILSYKEEQYRQTFPYARFDEQALVQWTEAHDYFTGTKQFVLVDEVYYPLAKRFLGRKKYTSANSSGIAAHFSRARAMEKAVFELIERDAFMIVWFNRLGMPKVRENSLPKDIERRIKVLRERGFSTYIFDITLDLSPVFLAVISSSKQGFASFLGASSDWDTKRAVTKALDEAETLLYFSEKYKFCSIKKNNIKTPQDHGMYYRDIKHLKNLDFLLKNKKEVRFRQNDKKTSLERVKANKMKIFCIDLFRGSRKEDNFFVVKALIPGLVPIPFGFNKDPLGMKRISEVPRTLGFNKRTIVYTDEPHPFA